VFYGRPNSYMAVFSFPFSSSRLSGIQLRYSRREDQTRCLFCPRAAPRYRLTRPLTYLRFPCLEVTAGIPFTIRPVTSLLLPGGPSPCLSDYRTAFGYYAASDVLPARWHSRVPGTTFPRVKRCRTSHIPQVQTTEPVAACSTPAGSVTTRLAFENQTPFSVLFWSR